MARSTYNPREEYQGAGNLSAYTFGFKIETLEQLLVIEVNAAGVETKRVRGSDTTYISSVDFDPVDGGGTVNLLANLTDQYRLILLLANDEPTQPFEFKNKFDFTLKRIEAALDYMMGPIQRLTYLAYRSMKLSDLDDVEDFDPTLPPGMATAVSLIPSTNADGTGWDTVNNWTPVTDLTAAITAAASAVAAAASSATDAAASAAAAAASAASAGSGSSSEIAAAASAAAALASQIAAASSASNASTSETNAAASAVSANAAAAGVAADAAAAAASAAAALASQTAAATSASNASASATNAGTSETNAAASAAAAAASAASVAAPNVVGTFAAPYACLAGTSIPFGSTAYQNKRYIKGTGGVDMTANPQIVAGTLEGQELLLIGTSDTDTVLLEDGTGLELKGSWLAEANRALRLSWDNGQALWVEIARS